MKRRHKKEITALKEVHSHARMLSELSQWMETSVQNVSHLQARFSERHEWQIHEKEHGLLAEQQLETEKSETSKEQEQQTSLPWSCANKLALSNEWATVAALEKAARNGEQEQSFRKL